MSATYALKTTKSVTNIVWGAEYLKDAVKREFDYASYEAMCNYVINSVDEDAVTVEFTVVGTKEAISGFMNMVWGEPTVDSELELVGEH